MSEVGLRLRAIEGRIAAACARAGRSPDEVRLVGACKRQPMERLRAACEAGLRLFGENIVQEAMAHAAELETETIEWHLIGPLQSNKAKKAVELFSTVHSIDRLKIARVLDREAGKAGRSLSGLLEVNLGDEPTKHGFAPDEVRRGLAELADLEHVRIVGLMAIPPPSDEAEGARPWFRRLRQLRDDLFARDAWSGRPGLLSMGMSSDFEVAVEEGASYVRIGSDLFGPREN